MSCRICLYLVCAALISSCAVRQPDSSDQTLSKALPETTKQPYNYKEAADNANDKVVDGWLKTFNDPALEAIVSEAIQNNLNLRAAVSRVDAAAGYATQAGAELTPVIGATGKGLQAEGFSAGNPALTSSGASLNMSWELDLWGRVRSQAQAGEAAFDAAQYQLEWAYQSLAAQTAKTWYLLTEAQLQLNLAKEAQKIYEANLEIIQAKYDQGQVTSRELSLSRAQVAAGKATIRKAEGVKQQAARALETLLGRYPAAEVQGADVLKVNVTPVPVGLPSELLERRPDLRAAERAVAAQFLQIQSAEAARLPRISLTAGLGTSSNELSNILTLGNDYWAAGANFAAPIFTGGALAAQVDIQSAQYQESLANYGLLALRAFSEVEQGLSNEQLLREREDFLAEVLKESSEALRVAQIQFEVGKVDYLLVLQQLGQVVAAKVNLINIQNQRLQQRIDLFLALGGDYQSNDSINDQIDK